MSNVEIIEISEFGINEVNVTIKYEGKTYCGCLSELENNENR